MRGNLQQIKSNLLVMGIEFKIDRITSGSDKGKTGIFISNNFYRPEPVKEKGSTRVNKLSKGLVKNDK
jgi:hypothetical protein